MGAPPDPPDSAHPGHAGTSPIPPHDHGPPVDRSSVRSSQIIRWCVHLSVTIAFAVPAGLILAATLSRRGTLDAFTLVPVAVGGFAVVVLGWLIVALPRHWTAQGVDVRPCCLGIVARPMWWFRGRQAFVAWDDVHAIGRGTRTAGRGPAVSGLAAVLDRLSSLGHEVTLQVHLHRVDPRLSLPSWVTLVLPETTPGTATLPRLVLTVADAPRTGVERMLGAARGDLFDLDQSARRATGRPPGTAQERSRAEWVSLRGAGFAPPWLGRAGLAVVMMGAVAAACLLYAVVDGIVHGFEADELPVLVVLATVAVPVTGWSIYSLPRLVTDQGVAADDAGVTLAQQPRWWFRGTLVRIPWADVRSISEDVLVTGDAKNRMSHLVVELRLHRPQHGVVPTWVEVKRRRQTSTALVIMPGGRHRHGRVVAALRAVRPDYFPV
ncbi:MAG TPA: hypothetical protein VIP77_05230 [Jiangellaceae bacterium]